MNSQIAILIVVLIVGFAAIVYFINQKISELKNDSALGLIKQDLQGMNSRLDKAAEVFGSLQHQLGSMQELGRSLRDIQDVLKSPKLRGNVGEQLMNDLIKQQIPKGNYQLQYSFKSNEKVDAVIKTKNGLIPIDSKFPVENYLKFSQTKEESQKNNLHKLFEADVKKHIQVIAKKYILPSEGTVDFALMYVPGEAIYYDIMTTTDLCNFGSSSRVYLVSPQSFYYFLQTVLLSLEGEIIEEKAKEVMTFLKGIQIDAKKFGSELAIADKHIGNARQAMDKATASFTKLGGRIESANQLTGPVQKLQSIKPVTAKIESEETNDD